MKLSDVGERALVELARKICRRGPRVRIGIGDDAAAIDIDKRRCLVATTDMLVARTHFPPGTTPEQMGHKAVVVNLSDVAAMGAEPLALLFSVGLPRKLEVSFVRRIVRSMDAVARRYGTYVVGGDLDETDDITITGVAFGVADCQRLLTRSGARPGNLIAVTGELGSAAAGLKILLEKLPSEGYERLLRAQLEPAARVREGVLLAKSGKVTATIDVTDGLAANLWQISRESGAKLIIDYARLPVHRLTQKLAVHQKINSDDFVLFGGEDLELLFTVRRGGLARVQKALERVGTRVTVIGRVAEGRGVFMKKRGKIQKLPDRGYEHFVGYPKNNRTAFRNPQNVQPPCFSRG